MRGYGGFKLRALIWFAAATALLVVPVAGSIKLYFDYLPFAQYATEPFNWGAQLRGLTVFLVASGFCGARGVQLLVTNRALRAADLHAAITARTGLPLRRIPEATQDVS